MTATMLKPLVIRSGLTVPVAAVPVVSFAGFREAVIATCHARGRVVAMFGDPDVHDGVPAPPDAPLRIYAVLEDAAPYKGLSVLATTVEKRFRSLTNDCPEVHLFERELAEQWGVTPDGHPWLKPVRYVHRNGEGRDAWGRDASEPIAPGVFDFFRVEGPDIHEVAVGPVHAGVIEPGHFRFQCRGEEVLHLEIHLGYQHRGIENRLVGGPHRASHFQVEAIAGDTSIGHTMAWVRILESMSGIWAPPRADAIRTIALELERLANHTGDLGALAGDVGFLPTAQYCGRIRGEFLNLSAAIGGSRFGRGIVKPGGVAFDIDAALASKMLAQFELAVRDVNEAAELMFESPSVLARLEGIGVVPEEVATRLGLVGMAARASHLARDVRRDHPFSAYRDMPCTVDMLDTCDLYARAKVRHLDIVRAAEVIRSLLSRLPEGGTRTPMPVVAAGQATALAGSSLCVSLVEGWRGEICHVAITRATGAFRRYKIIDPSFHNWQGLAYALRGLGVSDFPVNNKSFNLSYCGHDL